MVKHPLVNGRGVEVGGSALPANFLVPKTFYSFKVHGRRTGFK